MKREELKAWAFTEYNENTSDHIEFYLNEVKCNVGDTAYIYSHENDQLRELEIVFIIRRSAIPDLYDSFILADDVLLRGERMHNADTSAEFITDKDCYLVWFNYKS